MQGDFTRHTFKPEKQYSSVRMQQGRVQLDADWNEQLDLQQHLDRTTTADVIGSGAAPKTGGGFEIGATPDLSDLTVRPGRLYVDGILCELEPGAVFPAVRVAAGRIQVPDLVIDGRELAAGQWLEVFAKDKPQLKPMLLRITGVEEAQRELTLHEDPTLLDGAATPRARGVLTYKSQPDYPGPDPAELNPVENRTDLVYLDVWERHISAIEDPSIRESALGGPDTATRTQVVYQVKVQQGVTATGCKHPIAGWPPPPSGGRLSTQLETTPPGGLCQPIAAGGYRGLENHLCRVEIHDPGDLSVATFKWSRDNASHVVTIEKFLSATQVQVKSLGRDQASSLRENDWVEVLDDAAELSGQPGTLAQITLLNAATRTLTLSKPVTGYDVTRHAKVRRWDQAGDAIATAAGPLALEDGIQVQFSGSGFRTGDYWSFAARSSEGTLEELKLAPPRGIRHHYCPLALVTWKTGVGDQLTASVENCPPPFPPLSDLQAEDVGFDNRQCKLPEAETVQEALERLCAARDLRHHNRHLHGWGIVCGLQVICGPDRAHVTIRPGYAIDSQGRDLDVPRPLHFALLEKIQEHDQQHPDSPILVNGRGQACLTMALDAHGNLAYAVEKYEPGKDGWKSIFEGSVLEDYYRDCLEEIVDFLKKELTPPPDQKDAPVGPVHERLAAGANLVSQLVNPAGQRIFVSEREHKILKGFYEGLKKAFSDEQTFCALFEGARPFPDYPFGKLGLDTIFGRTRHARLRLRPDGKEAYTAGPGLNPLKPSTTLNRYDLEQGKMVAQIDPLAGTQAPGTRTDTGAGAVQDIAFSPDSHRIYIIATTRGGENSFFRAGQIQAGTIVWQPVVTICGVKLLTLATTAADKDRLYAVGQKTAGGGGLYRIDPAAVDPQMKPIYEFTPTGLLAITPGGEVFAAAQSATSGQHVIKRCKVPGGQAATDIPLSGPCWDDLAVYWSDEQKTVYAVVGSDTKTIQALGLEGNVVASFTMPRTIIRLETYAPGKMLLVTQADGFMLTMIDMAKQQRVPDYMLPLQSGPVALAVHAATRRAYVLNQASDTLLTIDTKLFKPEFRFDFPALAKYRKQVLEAFADLVGHFVQYLKDCFCESFLVDCPESAGQEKIYLASVTIRDSKVRKVCNFSKRRYVKSFPTLEYWLSVLPILPLLKQVWTWFSCLVVADWFAKYNAPVQDEEQLAVAPRKISLGGIQKAAAYSQVTVMQKAVGEFAKRTQTVRDLWATTGKRFTQELPPQPAPTPALAPPFVGQAADRAEDSFKKAGAAVKRVQYDPAATAPVAAATVAVFRQPGPGDEVTLYEENGVVRYYTIARKAPAPEFRTELDSLTASLQAREAEIKLLREEVAADRAKIAETDQLRQEVTGLRSEMVRLADTHQSALAARDQQISELKSKADRLPAQEEAVRQLKAQVEALARRFPAGPDR